jgi:hypothetical protein
LRERTGEWREIWRLSKGERERGREGERERGREERERGRETNGEKGGARKR